MICMEIPLDFYQTWISLLFALKLARNELNFKYEKWKIKLQVDLKCGLKIAWIKLL